MRSRDRSRRLQNEELLLDHACKLCSSGGGWVGGMGRDGEEGGQNFLLWHDGSSLVGPCPPLAAGPRAGGPEETGGEHALPRSGSAHPFVWTQSVLAHFRGLAPFLHLPRRGDGRMWDNLCGRAPRPPGNGFSFLPPAPPEGLAT